MRLTDLDPSWLVKDGVRVGFMFKSPKTETKYYQSCFVVPTPKREQFSLFISVLGEQGEWGVQPCKPDFAWTVAGGIENATFETMTVTPSLDGSPGGLWHGFITNGEIR